VKEGYKMGASRGEGRKEKEGKKKEGRWGNCLQQLMGQKEGYSYRSETLNRWPIDGIIPRGSTLQ